MTIVKIDHPGTPEQAQAAALANAGHIVIYGKDESIPMSEPPRLRLDDQGQLQIAEDIAGDASGKSLVEAWHAVETVHHLGDWVALTFLYVDPLAREAYRSLAVLPVEVWNQVM
jgi:hypothetical protein